MANLFKKKFMRVPHMSVIDFLREIARNAYVDWLVILALSISTLAVLLFDSGYLYWQVSTGNYKNEAAAKPREEKIVNVDELNSLINKFKAKEANSAQARRGFSGPADPSR